jgi:hypothetical protein
MHAARLHAYTAPPARHMQQSKKKKKNVRMVCALIHFGRLSAATCMAHVHTRPQLKMRSRVQNNGNRTERTPLCHAGQKKKKKLWSSA